jgi:hypothetical protein
MIAPLQRHLFSRCDDDEAGNPAMAITNHNRAIELTPERADADFGRSKQIQTRPQEEL